MGTALYPHQLEAIEKLKSGSVLVADVGTGKSRTALAYFYLKECGGGLRINGKGRDKPMKTPKDLYIICPAKKRDSHEWEEEFIGFDFTGIDITVDSWNNIKKYDKVSGAFFVFDEQRVVGSGAWVKAFLHICRRNHWILLTGTPADTWMDLIPVFVANGFFKNKTDFTRQHVVFSPYAKFPKVEHYLGTRRLEKMRDSIYVKMAYPKSATHHHVPVLCSYDKRLYKRVWKDRWDPFEEKPIANVSSLCYLLRRVVNDDPSRINACAKICERVGKVIIFYNYVYEYDALCEMLSAVGMPFASWNGAVHEGLPTGDTWAYLVQYNAGAEAWNCTTANAMIFYSQNYSYRIMIQAAGRIDRLNTPFADLYYYHLKSHAPIDLAIGRALSEKKKFNERAFVGH